MSRQLRAVGAAEMFGLLNIHKPGGCTSRDVVNRVARLAGRRVKVGHAGTLDPLASGVLVVCVGPATRLVPLIHEHQKSYVGTFQLGQRSDTDDIDGVVEAVDIPESLTAERLQEILPEFVGTIRQIPPVYSAVKVDGRRAYALARAGEVVELTERTVTVSRLDLLDFSLPRFRLSIDCGTGTYIRSIGRDLAQRLGTNAVMTELVRTRVGPFRVEEAIELESLTKDHLREHLLSPLEMLGHLPRWQVDEEQAKRLRCGQALLLPAGLDHGEQIAGAIALIDPQGQLFAIGERQQERLAPQIVLTMKE